MASTAELIFRITPQAGDFKATMAQVRSELTQSAQTQATVAKGELATRQQLAAAASLQRQRSAALIGEWKQTERAAADLARGVGPVKDNLQKVTDIMQTLGGASATLTGPLGGVAGRLRSVGALASEAAGGLGIAGVAAGAAVVAVVALAVGTALLTKEFLSLVVATADWEGKLHDQSQQVDVSVETLGTLDVALLKTGGSLDSASNALVLFQTKLDEAQDPASKTSELFKQLGITATDTEGAFRQALKAVASMPEGFERVNTAAELFGRRGAKQLLAATNEVNGDIDALARRLQKLGVLLSGDAAQAADQFNDELLIVQLQIRALTAALVNDSIPIILRGLEATSKIISENREAINLFGQAIALFVEGNARVLMPALTILISTLKGVANSWILTKIAADLATNRYGDAATEIANINAELEKLNKTAAKPVIPEAEYVTPGSRVPDSRVNISEVAAAKLAAQEAKRISQEKIAQAELDYQSGKITRQKQSNDIKDALRRDNKAQVDAINAEIAQNQRRLYAFEGNAAEQRIISEKVFGLEEDRKDKLSTLQRAIAKEESDAFRDQNKRELDRLESLATIRKQADAADIERIQAQSSLGEITIQEGENRRTKIENDGLQSRREILDDELAINAQGFETQKRIKDALAALEREKTETLAEQAERRKKIFQVEIEFETRLLLSNLDAQLRLGAIGDERRTSSLRALAALRIRTEEETERAILAIRLAAIEREAAAIRAHQTAARSIADPNQRRQELNKLNDDLLILGATRKSIEEQGERDVETGRQRDLDGLRRYQDSYKRLLHDGLETERDIKRLRIQLLIASGASRRQILRAEFEEDLTAANRHHAQELKQLREDYDAALESAKGMQEKLEALKAYHAAVAAENERHALGEKERKDREAKESALAGPIGGFLGGLDTGQLTQLSQGVKDFQDVAIVAFSAVGAAVNGLAQGIGSLVQNWVLMGSTGPDAMRKTVASVLAGVAAQSAVLAIFELAKGFASLFFNPAEAVAHFQAAALFGSIAVGTALAGRAVAGNSFQSSTGETTGVTSTRDQTVSRDRTIRESRQGGASNSNQIIGRLAIDLKHPDGTMETQMVRIVKRNGSFRATMREDLLGEANG